MSSPERITREHIANTNKMIEMLHAFSNIPQYANIDPCDGLIPELEEYLLGQMFGARANGKYSKHEYNTMVEWYALACRVRDRPFASNTPKSRLTAPIYEYTKGKANLPITQYEELFWLASLYKNPNEPVMPMFELTSPNVIPNYLVNEDTVDNVVQSQLAKGNNVSEDNVYDVMKNEIFNVVNNFDRINPAVLRIDGSEYSIPVIYEEFADKSTQTNKFQIRSELIDAVNEFETNRDNIQSVSEIPIYFVIIVGAGRGIHASVIVLYNNRMFSIGFGYAGDVVKKINLPDNKVLNEFKLKNAAIYSPDYLIQPSRENRIVDIGILSRENIENLNKYITSADILLSGLDIKYDDDGEPITDKDGHYVYNIDHELGGVAFTKHTLAYSDIANKLQYSKVSNPRINNKFLNCSSFVETVFSNIKCGRLYSDPKNCNTSPPLDKNKIDQIIKAYGRTGVTDIQSFIQLLTDKQIVKRKRSERSPEQSSPESQEGSPDDSQRHSFVFPEIRKLLTAKKTKRPSGGSYAGARATKRSHIKASRTRGRKTRSNRK